jgi:hypothetical protein
VQKMIAYFMAIMILYWITLAVFLYREAQTRKLAHAELEKKLEDKAD